MHHEVYFALVRDILKAAPSVWPYIESINNHILTGEVYKALKHATNHLSTSRRFLTMQRRAGGWSGRGANRQSA